MGGHNRFICLHLLKYRQTSMPRKGPHGVRFVVDAVPVGMAEYGPVMTTERSAHVADEAWILDLNGAIDPD